MIPAALPESCAVAFKEWAGVCASLAAGRQRLILRKGGISEGPGGFTPEYPAFWLYPTSVHEGEQGLKPGHAVERSNDATSVAIDTLIVVERVTRVDDLDVILGLDGLHVWTEETVRKRFDYRKPGLWVLGARAYRRSSPFQVEITPAQLGCKTWVPLETPLSTAGLTPARTEAEAALDRVTLQSALGSVRRGS